MFKKQRKKKNGWEKAVFFLTGNKWGVGTEEQFQHGQDQLEVTGIGSAAAFHISVTKELPEQIFN